MSYGVLRSTIKVRMIKSHKPCRDWSKKTGQDQKLTNSKKTTIFELSLWHFVKMTYLSGGPFGQVSWWYLKNCGFFIGSQFLNLSSFFGSVFMCNSNEYGPYFRILSIFFCQELRLVRCKMYPYSASEANTKIKQTNTHKSIAFMYDTCGVMLLWNEHTVPLSLWWLKKKFEG